MNSGDINQDQKGQSKFRSRNYRKRKKDYYEDLESKVSVLEKEVSKLQAELSKYKKVVEANKIDINNSKLYPEFAKDEDFAFDEAVNMTQERPELSRLSFHLQLWENYGPNSKSRIEFINTLFDSIIDNIAPVDCKIGYAIRKEMTAELKLQIQKCSEMPKYK